MSFRLFACAFLFLFCDVYDILRGNWSTITAKYGIRIYLATSYLNYFGQVNYYHPSTRCPLQPVSRFINMN